MSRAFDHRRGEAPDDAMTAGFAATIMLGHQASDGAMIVGSTDPGGAMPADTAGALSR